MSSANKYAKNSYQNCKSSNYCPEDLGEEDFIPSCESTLALSTRLAEINSKGKKARSKFTDARQRKRVESYRTEPLRNNFGNETTFLEQRVSRMSFQELGIKNKFSQKSSYLGSFEGKRTTKKGKFLFIRAQTSVIDDLKISQRPMFQEIPMKKLGADEDVTPELSLDWGVTEDSLSPSLRRGAGVCSSSDWSSDQGSEMSVKLKDLKELTKEDSGRILSEKAPPNKQDKLVFDSLPKCKIQSLESPASGIGSESSRELSASSNQSFIGLKSVLYPSIVEKSVTEGIMDEYSGVASSMLEKLEKVIEFAEKNRLTEITYRQLRDLFIPKGVKASFRQMAEVRIIEYELRWLFERTGLDGDAENQNQRKNE